MAARLQAGSEHGVRATRAAARDPVAGAGGTAAATAAGALATAAATAATPAAAEAGSPLAVSSGRRCEGGTPLDSRVATAFSMTAGSMEAAAASPDPVAVTVMARHRTPGSTAAGITAGITAVTIADTIRFPLKERMV